MTPKEKAKELFDKYYRLFNNFPNYQYVIENLNTIQDEKLYITKQCALILVSSIIMENLRYDYTPFEGSRTAYFLEVEKEILAL